MRHLVLVPMFFCLAGVAVSQSSPRVPTPVAVELFTSQGCSSCPPADALVEQLAREPNTIVLTRPVTYWDRLGWKDTLAREGNTELQRAYARRGGAGAGVYTPQAVVQGGAATVGSRQSEVRALIAAEKAKPGPAIRARLTPDGGRLVTIEGGTGGNARIQVLALRAEAVVRIGAGENGGRTVRYTNVVVHEAEAGTWRGGVQAVTIPATALRRPGANRYALVLRDGVAGRIVAARYI